MPRKYRQTLLLRRGLTLPYEQTDANRKCEKKTTANEQLPLSLLLPISLPLMHTTIVSIECQAFSVHRPAGWQHFPRSRVTFPSANPAPPTHTFLDLPTPLHPALHLSRHPPFRVWTYPMHSYDSYSLHKHHQPHPLLILLVSMIQKTARTHTHIV